MVPGFNTDFKYRGETYHIQTEDNGTANPVVVTLLYHKGAILASRRTSYRELAATPGYETRLLELMKNQHKELMRDLLAGTFDKNGSAPAVAGGSGEHPAAAAAAVAAAADPPRAIPGKIPPTPRVVIPSVAAPNLSPPSLQVRPTPVTPLPPDPLPAPAPTPRRVTMTLDQAIWHYLEQFASGTPSATLQRE